MKNKITTIAAIFSYFVLYSPQPLFPFFADYYNISIASAGALMTATLIPLALAPLLYGYLLSSISPLRLLRYALFTMAISCLLFACSNNYHLSFAVRFIQGLLLPAVLTAITTYIATHSAYGQLQKNMSLYITGTIIGGLLGRILSGLFATYWSWQFFYYGLTLALFVTAIAIKPNNKEEQQKPSKLPFLSITRAFITPGVTKIYCAVFCLFFSFVAVLNYLPFIIEEMLGKTSPAIIGLTYIGFIMGAVSSLNAQRLLTLIGKTKNVMMIGFLFFLGAIILLFIPNIIITVLVLFIFCGSMFLVHSIAATEVNRLSQENKNIINALYMTFYYSGGVVGSYFPGLIYQHYGQIALLSCLLITSSMGLILILLLKPTDSCVNLGKP